MKSTPPQALQIGRGLVLTASRRVIVDGVDARLGGRAFDLLMALVQRRGSVVGKEELLDLVWPGLAVEPNNLQVHVWALRRVFGHDVIRTVARRGYQLDANIAPAMQPPAADPQQLDAVAPDGLGAATELSQLAVQWAHRLEQVRWLGIVGATAEAREFVCQVMCHAYARRAGVAVWHWPAAHWNEHVAQAHTVRRLQRVGGVVVVKEGDSLQGRHVADWVSELGAGGNRLRAVVTCAEAPWAAPQNITVVPSLAVRHKARGAAEPSALRWRQRGTA